MWDLPHQVREYFCVNCGERFWVDISTLTFEIRPVTMPLRAGLHLN